MQASIHSRMLYTVVRSISTTLPWLLAAAMPLGQSTPQKIVKTDPVDAVKAVKLLPGHRFSATPLVPVVTGAEDVFDAMEVGLVLEGSDETGISLQRY